MKTLLPTKRIIELFSSGYQMFYLGLTIDTDGKVSAGVAPDVGWLETGLQDVKRELFNENVKIANEFAIVPNSEGDSKAIELKSIFLRFYQNVKNVFTASPGILNGKKVVTVKIFQIDVTVDNANNIIKPWSIKEVDKAKFRPQIKTNLPIEDYLGYLPSVLKEEFKFISQRMRFPKEAKDRGVRGRVLVKLFFESDGEYAGYQLIKGLGYGCDEEVINTIKSFKPKCYSSGQRSTVIVPFQFGISDATPVDLTADPLIEQNPTKYNNLYYKIYNKIKLNKSLETKFSLSVYINNEKVSWFMANFGFVGEAKLFFHWKPKDPGSYDYVILIDPENVLNDIDRSNNTIKGKLVIK
ncbi:MAG: energy transducer TonB [Ignavibacteria bacterium]|nr:energy transducer TonB [Ignavibacteria bacterium]